jgi:pimeloyl-ACP methyl ester carboxylesterase
MAKPNPPNPFRHLRSTDLRGLAKLATQATVNVTKMAEGVTQSVWSTLGAPSGKEKGQTRDTTRGITGLVYKTIQSVTQLVGKGTESLLTSLQPLLDKIDKEPQESAPREAVLAVLNGVMGDRLVESDNPLATPMSLRFKNETLNWEAMPDKALLTGKVLIVVHGLCMNDLQWAVQVDEKTVNHAEALAAKLGYTPVYVRYNTGLHTSQNGQTLSNQLELLSALWPVPLTDISVLVHSMGGLVTRSAVHAAQQRKRLWVKKLKNIVFLGTPHHGAPLEKAGNWIDVLLGTTPFSAPFKKLAELRSAGITDLRFGYVLDSDWEDQDPKSRFKPKTKQEQIDREHLPLPAGVACFTVAATLAAKRSLLADRLIGDGLVPLNSALGVYSDPDRSLAFAKSSQMVVYRTNHMALLGSLEVSEQLLTWLT